jgi:MFS transporter, PHS family, inorganic phosphate transporter
MTVGTVDIIGRKPIQLAGFIILTLLFCIMGFAFHHLSTSGLFALYVIAQFFFNFGPNATTFILPGECFPTRYRSSAHGISAGAGKLGAIIAQVAISTLRTNGGATPDNPNPWLDHTIQIFALFMLFGCLSTLLVPETARKTLEEISGEEPAAVDALESMHGRTVGGWGAGTNRLQAENRERADTTSTRRSVPVTGSAATAYSSDSNERSGHETKGWKRAFYP